MILNDAQAHLYMYTCTWNAPGLLLVMAFQACVDLSFDNKLKFFIKFVNMKYKNFISVSFNPFCVKENFHNKFTSFHQLICNASTFC